MYNDSLSPNIFKPRNDWGLVALKSRKAEAKSEREISVNRIADIILTKYGRDPLSNIRYRGREYATARQLLMVMLYRHTKKTQRTIADIMGMQDHSIVNYAVRAMNDLCDTDIKFRDIFCDIDKEIAKLVQLEKTRVSELKGKIPTEV